MGSQTKRAGSWCVLSVPPGDPLWDPPAASRPTHGPKHGQIQGEKKRVTLVEDLENTQQ